MSQDDAVRNTVQNDGSKNANKTQYFSFKTFIELKWYLCDKKRVFGKSQQSSNQPCVIL